MPRKVSPRLPADMRDSLRATPSRAAIRLGLAALVSAVGWAHFTELPEIAYAVGRLEPSSAVRRLEHPDGGTVTDLFLAEGDRVKSGDLVARFSPVQVEAELRSLNARAQALKRSHDRAQRSLAALGIDPMARVVLPEDDPVVAASLQAYETRRIRLAHQIDVRRNAIEVARARVSSFAEQEQVIRQDLDRLSALRDAGLVTGTQWLESRNQMFSAAVAAIDAGEALSDAISQEADALEALVEFHVQTRDALFADLTEAEDNLSIVQEGIKAAEARRERLSLLMPTDGVVQTLHVRTIGEVLDAGGLIAEFLPDGEELIAVVDLNPIDAGHVQVGDPVDIRLTTYEIKRYGTLSGVVEQISPTSIEDEQGRFAYRVRLRLDQQTIGEGENMRALRAGIEVNASIITGTRSVLAYALTPLAEPFRNAFIER